MSSRPSQDGPSTCVRAIILKMQISDLKNSKNAPGKKELLKFLSGQKLSASQACRAKCFECNSGYLDGKQDCGVLGCPIYSRMPYKSKLKCEKAPYDTLFRPKHDLDTPNIRESG